MRARAYGARALTQLLKVSGDGPHGVVVVSAVQKVIAGLQAAGVPAEWHNTGGGCMAISVGWGPETEDSFHMYEILITDKWDPFGQGDYVSDENVSGFNAGFYAFKWDQDQRSTPDEGCLLYVTPESAGQAASELDPEDHGAFGTPVDLGQEVDHVVAAVAAAYDQVFTCERYGRSMYDVEWATQW